MFPVIGLLLGAVGGLLINYHVPQSYSVYTAMAILAAFDSVFGAILASMHNNFKLSIFVTGFFGNAFIAVVLTVIGNSLGVDFSLAAIIVFGTRLFNNFATMRRIFINKHTNKNENQ
ncbi:MAG: small basic family protein [Bacillota bacterium]|nr:small basic family protein [Bacillota bacterium]